MHTPTAKLIIVRMRVKAAELLEVADELAAEDPPAAAIHRHRAHGLDDFAYHLLKELTDAKAPTVEAMELHGHRLMIATTPKLDEKTVERLRDFMMQPPNRPGRCRCVVSPVCPVCNGTGRKGGNACVVCDGQG